MILCDSNVWLALVLGAHVHHGPARAWLDTVEDIDAVRFNRATQLTLLRLLTTAAVLAPYRLGPLTNTEANAVLDAFLADDRISLQLDEPAETSRLWSQFAGRDSASPKLWMDAYLAAFSLAGGLSLVTTDTAFRQFDGLDLVLLG